LGDRLAETLNYKTISRGQLYGHVHDRYGVSRDDIAAVMEQAPTMLGFAQSRGTGESMVDRRERVFWLLQSALCELLEGDDAIYHGQAGHLLLPGISHVLRVRIVAPRSRRIAMCMERGGGDELDASRRIDQVDAERSRWTRALYGVDWSDPEIFDIVLNLESMDIEQMGDLIAKAIELPAFTATDESRGAMRDLCIRSRVMAKLVSEPVEGRPPVRLDVTGGELVVHTQLPEVDLAMIQSHAESCRTECGF
jgi:cytidylate kinase